jgi:hypothetical protein
MSHSGGKHERRQQRPRRRRHHNGYALQMIRAGRLERDAERLERQMVVHNRQMRDAGLDGPEGGAAASPVCTARPCVSQIRGTGRRCLSSEQGRRAKHAGPVSPTGGGADRG